MHTSMEKIARQAGVSQSTVSRALSGKGGVSPSTRKRILDLARSQNYFETGKRVAVIVNNISEMNYSVAVLSEIENVLQQSNLLVDMVPQTSLPLLETGTLCGAIAILNTDLIAQYWGEKTAVPLVCINTKSRSWENVYSVYSDEVRGMEFLAEKVIQAGHRKIAVILGAHCFTADDYFSTLRKKTLEKIFRNHNLTTEYFFPIAWPYEFDVFIPRFRKEGITAAICCSEEVILPLAHYLRVGGYRIPEDFSLVGLLPEVARYFDPPLTGIAQNFRYLGENAIRMLLRLLQREPVNSDIVIAYHTFERNSVAPVPAGRPQ